MSRIADLRSGVMAGVVAITGLSSADIVEAGLVDDAFALLPRLPGVAVVFEGLEATEPALIGSPGTTAVAATFSLVVVAEEWTSPAGAKESLDSLVEALRGIRLVDVGALLGRPVRLRLLSETVTEPPNRPDAGGPLAVVCRYRTTAFTV